MRVPRRQALVALSVLAVALVSLTIVGSLGAAATVVPLGTAAQFAVLAGSGITNTGATTIGGDSGSSPTSSQTGWAACPGDANCVTQTGANHVDPDPNDAATVLAKEALTNAYDVAAGQTPTVIPTELAGQTLAPGVYSSASGTFGMTGTLTLDAANDPDAVFIFQTAEGTGTLITGATGDVVMIRSAQSCNVFWKVGTSATLGAGSTFRGTIMAHTSISLGASVTVDGRLLAGEQASGAGAVTLINDTIIKPVCAVTPPPDTTPVVTDTTPVATDTTPVATDTTPVLTDTTPTGTPVASTAATAARVEAARRAAARATAARVAAQRVAAQRAAAQRAAALSLRRSRSNARPAQGTPGFTG